MTRSDGISAIALLAVLGTAGTAMAQDNARTPAIFNVDLAIMSPFMDEAAEQASLDANHASIVASGVLSETGLDSGALSAFSGYSASVNQLDDGSRIEVRVFDPGLQSRANRLFDPQSTIDSAIVQPVRETRSSVAVDYVTRFDSPGGEEGLDLTLEPRAGLSFGPEGSGAGAGAEVRIGRYLQGDGERPSWYFFAGAERHALLYDPREGFDMQGAMRFEPYAVVGDAQAGVAMRLGENDLSFAYVRRERNARIGMDDYDETDAFAAFSLSRRW